jgi:Tol biopolymer transport system component
MLHPIENKIFFVSMDFDGVKKRTALSYDAINKFICYNIDTKEITYSKYYLICPAISNDGKTIYYYGAEYIKSKKERTLGIFSMNLKEKNKKLVIEINKLSQNLSMSSDNSKILFLSSSPDSIMEVNVDGSNLHEIQIDKNEILNLF